MSAPQLTAYQSGLNQVSGDQFNTFLEGCDNMSQLRGFIGLVGMKVMVGGFSANNDGGEGIFYWNATGTGPDDNGVTNVVPNGSAIGCWTRLGTSGTGGVSSISSPGNTITFSASTGAVNADINLAKSNTWTGTQTIPLGTNSTSTTQSPGDNTTKVSSTAFVTNAVAAAVAPLAPLNSPVFTGTPTLPTGATGVTQGSSDNSTKLATTAYVRSQTATLPTPLGVGSIIVANYTALGTLAVGTPVAAANLANQYFDASSLLKPSGDALAGTWVPLQSIGNGGGAFYGLFMRTS